MNDLDEKLKSILNNPLFKIVSSGRPHIRDGHAEHDIDGDVEAIKQAFIDAGWEPVLILNREQSFMATGDRIYKTATLRTEDEWKARNEGKLMTGQEWYDRFVKELEKIGAKDKIRSMNGIIVKNAAKRASVLERE